MRNAGHMTPEEWLTKEDSVCREDRLARLKWLASKTPDGDYWLFSGGSTSKYMFEEARYCFAYGQFLATIVLAFAYIEHTLASLLYMSGRDEAERARASDLLKYALDCQVIDEPEFASLDRAREVRNSVIHFRSPMRNDTLEFRSVMKGEPAYSVIEDDARHVMEIALRLLSNTSP